MAENELLLQRLRDWIESKEAQKRQHDGNLLLNIKEAELIQKLLVSSAVKVRYISLLNELLQANGATIPKYEDEAVGSNFRSWCNVGAERFPREGYGLEPGQGAPGFPNKKDAKEHAAKSAYEYFARLYKSKAAPDNKTTGPPSAGRENGSNDGSTTSPVAKRVKLETQASDPKGARGLSTVASAPASSPSVFEDVALMAMSLGMVPPQYKVEPDNDVKDGFFMGKAIFTPGTKVPVDLGSVRQVLGKSECKTQVAQAVSAWMKQELRQREELTKRLISKVA